MLKVNFVSNMGKCVRKNMFYGIDIEIEYLVVYFLKLKLTLKWQERELLLIRHWHSGKRSTANQLRRPNKLSWSFWYFCPHADSPHR